MLIRIIKFSISILVYSYDHFRSYIHRLLGLKNPGSCVVLYYHAVTREQRSRFASQMDNLVRLARPVPSYFKERDLKGIHHVVVTFDDGFVSVIENAIPELTARQIPCTIFVPTGSLGKHPTWVNEQSHPFYKENVISANQLKSLDRELISIGSHCVTHLSLLLLDEQTVRKELSESRKALELIMRQDIRLLSFPHGAYNKRILRLARQVGYHRVFTISPEVNYSGSEKYVIGRVNVDPNDWCIEFKLKSLGSYRWLPMAYWLKRKTLELVCNRNFEKE